MSDNLVAIIFSAISLTAAIISLGWNIYRDTLLKARIRITQIIGPIVTVGTNSISPMYIFINIVNCGPGNVALTMLVLKNTSVLRRIRRIRPEHALLTHDYENPLSGKLPKELKVGETVAYIFPYDKKCFLKEQMTHIGITDSFGRTHWMKKALVRKMNKQWTIVFGRDDSQNKRDT